jgi:DNA-binding beta-propeller fold protein YncE
MNLEAQPLPRSLPPANLPMLLAEPLWQTPPGCGAGDLLSPRGVAVDVARGQLYVADGDGRQVLGLALDDGRVLERYALADFAEPVDVALLGAAEGSGDGMGALLVLDAVVPAIFKIDLATGESGPLALSTGFYRPRGLAVDALGHIGVADTGGARVVILDATGAPLAQFGGPQTALGQGQPVAVMALGGQWWAMAADAGRLWRLDVLGSLAVSARANTVTGPHLAPLPDGRGFFLSDSVQRTVLYLAATGEPLAQLGYSDTLVNPTGVAAYVGVDGLLHLAVADSGTCSVGIWRVRL